QTGSLRDSSSELCSSDLVAELARRSAAGQVPFLREKRFIWINARYVPPIEKGARLVAILAHLARRTDLIACIEGLANLLRGEHRSEERRVGKGWRSPRAA